jgi:hypothetical protein
VGFSVGERTLRKRMRRERGISGVEGGGFIVMPPGPLKEG